MWNKCSATKNNLLDCLKKNANTLKAFQNGKPLMYLYYSDRRSKAENTALFFVLFEGEYLVYAFPKHFRQP